MLTAAYAFPSYALKEELTKYQIVESATRALNKDGFDLYRVEIIYDQNNKMWREKVNKMTDLQNSPNFKLFERGFMKNYQAVLFNFKNPPGEVWVFVDRDTGEVLEIHRPESGTERKKKELSPVFY
jgi:hypothetical protein